MRHSSPSMLKICVKHTWFPLLIIAICAWLYGVKYVLEKKGANVLNASVGAPFNVMSYVVSTAEYRTRIPSIQYEKAPPFPTTPKQLDYFPMNQLMTAWDFDDTSPEGWLNSPAHPNKGKSVPRFDFSVPEQRAIALEYRNKEIPFIVFNVPEVERAIEKTFTRSKLLENFGEKQLDVEKSASNRFMYYKPPKRRAPEDWVQPQEDVTMTFKQYLGLIEKAELNPHINRNMPLFYMSISAGEGWKTQWVREALPIFEKKESFWIVDPEQSRGINCRFGMKGVSAAVHYDGGRNFIVMLRGRKRYVLLPPEECPKLELFPKAHPSGRHSRLDWSNATELSQYEDLYHAKSTEAVISQGEVLYLPSYWFHYIVSQDGSIQCNSRSGDSDLGKDAISECGFATGGHGGGGRPKKRKPGPDFPEQFH